MNHRLHLLTLCVLLIFTLSACQTAEIEPPQWQWERAEVGLPRQAIMVAVAADPLDPIHLWAGYYAAGGLATSHDGGQTWLTGAEGLADNPVFDLLPVAYTLAGQPQVEVWAATRDGLLVSTDAGDSWQTSSRELPTESVFALAADAAGRVYVGLDEGGVYAQTPDGIGWVSLAETDSSLASVGVISLAVSPDGRSLYAGTSTQGIFASQDGGQTWVSTYADRYTAANIAVNPTNPKQAIASLREQTVGDDNLAKLIEDLSTKDRLVRSADGGQTWHTLPLDWTNDEVTSLLWLPDGSLGAGTARGQLYRSIDGGDTWQGGVTLPGGGILDLAVGGQTENGPRLLAATWTGLYASDDGGQTWPDLAPVLGVPNAQTLLTTENDVLLGTRTGLYRWQPESRSWQLLSGDITSGVASLAAAPESQPLYLGTGGDGVYRSDDTGTTWHKLPALGVSVPDLVVDPQNANHLYLLAAWERPYESLDGGRTWHARWEGLGDVVETVSLAIDPLKPITYVGTEFGLYRSRQGEIWQLITPELGGQSVLALLAEAVPTTFWNDSVLYIGTTRGVYRSLDGGNSIQGTMSGPGWGYGLEDISVTAFLVDSREPRLLYAGTAYNGVYQSVDAGKTWQPVGPPDLTDDVVEAMAWGATGEIFMVTTSGVWLGERVD